MSINYSEKVKYIHKATMKLIETTGMRFMHPKAIEILKSNGIRCEGNKAFFTEEQLMYWVHKAPSTFNMYALDPKYNMTIGGEHVNPAPSYGAPFVSKQDGTRYTGTSEDYAKFVKLYEQDHNFKMNGGLIIQPGDFPQGNANALMFYEAYRLSDKCMFVAAGHQDEMAAMFKMAEEMFGGKEKMLAKPCMTTIIDVITPLTFDVHMTDDLMLFAEYGQPMIVASCSQAGTTAPVTLGGPITYTNAEVLCVIALAQMVRPGTPVMYGSQTTNADLRNGAIASGSPEGALCYKYCTEMAQFYGLPSRGGGALSDSKVVNAQAGYESMLSYLTCAQNHMNLIVHAAGIMDGYQSISYEKLILDFQVIDCAMRYLKDEEFDENTVPVELMSELGHGAMYLAEEHTFENCRDAIMTPRLSVCGPCSDPATRFDSNIETQMEKMLAAYEKPERDEAVLAKLRELLIGRGVDAALLDKIDTL